MGLHANCENSSIRAIVYGAVQRLVRSQIARFGALVFASILFLSAAQAAHADTFIGGTTAWDMVGSPAFPTSVSTPAVTVTYSNSLPVTVAGIVIMVIRNNASQTVYFSTGTITLSSGALGPASLVEFGLNPGTYNATFFAFTFGGVAISAPTSALFTLPR